MPVVCFCVRGMCGPRGGGGLTQLKKGSFGVFGQDVGPLRLRCMGRVVRST